jgi:eukaryotic-like serine/threonine-protein kinase
VWNVATGLRQGPALTVRDAQRVLAVAFSPDGAILATGCANGTTYLWHTASGKLAIVAGGGLTYRWQSRAASATVSATGTLTDPATGAADASSVAFGASGTWLVTGDPSGSAQIWESRS